MKHEILNVFPFAMLNSGDFFILDKPFDLPRLEKTDENVTDTLKNKVLYKLDAGIALDIETNIKYKVHTFHPVKMLDISKYTINIKLNTKSNVETNKKTKKKKN